MSCDFIQCELCGKRMPDYEIHYHLKQECSSTKEKSDKPGLTPSQYHINELARDAIHAMDLRLKNKEEQVEVSKDFYEEVTQTLKGQDKTARQIVKEQLPKELLAKIRRYIDRIRKINPRMKPEEAQRRAAKKFNIELT